VTAQRTTAAALVDGAMTEQLREIPTQESAAVGIAPQLATALNGIRADDSASVATIAELIAPPTTKGA
jgi:hypothetical protein